MLEFFLKTAAVSASIAFGTALVLYSPATIAGEVTLAWNASASPNVAGYRVHYGLSSGSYPNKIVAGNQTSYTLSGLDSGKTYHIVVTTLAANGTGESDFSNEAVVEIPFPDSDNDGMPDAFETANGLDPLDALDAALDNDRDGLTNLKEFQAGRDPMINEPAVLQVINSILFD